MCVGAVDSLRIGVLNTYEVTHYVPLAYPTSNSRVSNNPRIMASLTQLPKQP